MDSASTDGPNDKKTAVMGAGAFVRRVLGMLGPYRGVALVVLVALLIEMGFGGAVPLAFKYLIDKALIPRDRHLLLVIVGALSTGVVLVAVVGVQRDYGAARLQTRLLNDLRLRIFEHLQSLS